MKFLVYAVSIVLGLIVVAMLGVFLAATFLAIRDEIRRRCEKDVPPLIAGLRRDFFREDIDRLQGVRLWFLWYEDRFDLENSMSFGISVHFSEADARAAFDRRGRPLEPGWDGYTIEGPVDALTTGLFGLHRVEMLREVLKRLKSGSTEWIPMKS